MSVGTVIPVHVGFHIHNIALSQFAHSGVDFRIGTGQVNLNPEVQAGAVKTKGHIDVIAGLAVLVLDLLNSQTLESDLLILLAHQNEKVAFKGLTVEKIEYKNGEPGDDIYVTLGLDGTSLNFCVEVYLTGTDSEVYTAVGELAEGDVVDVEAYMYWYDGPNAHLTSVAKAA